MQTRRRRSSSDIDSSERLVLNSEEVALTTASAPAKIACEFSPSMR